MDNTDKKKDILAAFLDVDRAELDSVPTFYIAALHQVFAGMTQLEERIESIVDEDFEEIVVYSPRQYKTHLDA